jgi:carbon starvation protein
MSLAVLVISVVLLFVVGYQVYARKMDRDIMEADPERATPATMYQDGVDFMPASASVLFGYQFKSIAALGPIVGPITALQYGWLPALLWILIGTFFIGWVQDYASALLSMRNEGMTMGGLSYKLISPRSRGLLLSFLYIYLLLIMGAFGAIISPLLANPVVPFGFLIIVLSGVLAGQMTYRWKQDLLLTTVVTVLIALVGAWVGTLPLFAGDAGVVAWINGLVGGEGGVLYETQFGAPVTWSFVFWAIMMMLFCYLGSVLPIWRFAQPVNYTSFWFVAISMVLSVLGITIATFTGSVGTSFEIPAYVTFNQPHLGPMWPLLFVTIACGAISGWHSLVSTSGTARQLEKETDTLPVGGGAMFLEGVLAVLALIMGVTLIAKADGTAIYDAAQNYKLVAGAAGVFAGGMARFMNVVGVPTTLGSAVGSIFLVVMGITIMQLVVRFMRIASAELLGDAIPALKNPHVGSIVALLLTLLIVFTGYWQWIWVLFGGSNQLFASLALLLVTIWLAGQKKRHAWVGIPAVFMYVTTIAALLWVSVRNALIMGIINAEPGTGVVFYIGNGISALFGLYMAVAAVLLGIDALKAFNKAQAEAPAGAAAGD